MPWITHSGCGLCPVIRMRPIIVAALASVGYLNGEVTSETPDSGEVRCADLVHYLMDAVTREPLPHAARLLAKRLCAGFEGGSPGWAHLNVMGMGSEMYRELNRSTIEYLAMPPPPDIGDAWRNSLLREWTATKARRVSKLLRGHLFAYGRATRRMRAELDDRAVVLLSATDRSIAVPAKADLALRVAELENDGWTLVRDVLSPEATDGLYALTMHLLSEDLQRVFPHDTALGSALPLRVYNALGQRFSRGLRQVPLPWASAHPRHGGSALLGSARPTCHVCAGTAHIRSGSSCVQIL
jgi:hypothetical protein